jgi:hypothetical protein
MDQNPSYRCLSEEELRSINEELRMSPVFKAAQVEAGRVLQKHLDALDRCQRITSEDLATIIH